MLVAVAMVVTVACNCPSSLIKGAAQMEKNVVLIVPSLILVWFKIVR